MKILFVNKFLFEESGVTLNLFALAKRLKAEGHTVAYFGMAHEKNIPNSWSKYFVSGVDFSRSKQGLWQRLRVVGRMMYSWEARKDFGKLLDDFQPDVVHVHNIYHHISPSILGEAKKRGIGVVMTAHDYKLVSPYYTLYDGKHICDDEVGRNFWKTVVYRRMNNSVIQSLLVYIESLLHQKVFRFYKRHVDTFICPSVYLRDKLIQGGYDPLKCMVIPPIGSYLSGDPTSGIGTPLVQDPPASPCEAWRAGSTLYKVEPCRKGVLYVGRLSQEKGVRELLVAWKKVKTSETLTIIGEGEERQKLESLVNSEKIAHVVFTGWKTQAEVFHAMRSCKAVVIPSLFPEPFGMVALEALIQGSSIIVSNRGALPQFVNNQNGKIIDVLDTPTFTQALQDVCDASPKIIDELKLYERFDPERAFAKMKEVYTYPRVTDYTEYATEPAGLRRLRYIVRNVFHAQKMRPESTVRIADVGAGMGNASRLLARMGYDVTAIEMDAHTVSEARKKIPQTSMTYVEENIVDHEPSAPYDVIMAFDVLEHLEDPQKMLEKFLPMLTPSGRIVLSLPNGKRLEECIRKVLTHTAWGLRVKRFLKRHKVLSVEAVQSHAESPHLHFWSYNDIVQLCDSTGFVIVHRRQTSAGFKEGYYIFLRFFLPRTSHIFRVLDRLDSRLTRFVPMPIADGWLITAVKKNL